MLLLRETKGETGETRCSVTRRSETRGERAAVIRIKDVRVSSVTVVFVREHGES